LTSSPSRDLLAPRRTDALSKVTTIISAVMSSTLLASLRLVQQGAEARVYEGQLHEGQPPIIFKHRFKKQYRHPTLDNGITKSRVIMEARALMRCLRNGVSVPGIRMVDSVDGVIGVERIDGPSVRMVLGGGAEDEEQDEGGVEEVDNLPGPYDDFLQENKISAEDIMKLIGKELAKMHLVDIVHGDLTTSNMMLRRSAETSEVQVVLIDFGLSFQSALVEDKAVDLYVLERAFVSTHPESEPLFAAVLDAYEAESGKAWTPLKRRLDEVRLRGRKRSMVG